MDTVVHTWSTVWGSRAVHVCARVCMHVHVCVHVCVQTRECKHPLLLEGIMRFCLTAHHGRGHDEEQIPPLAKEGEKKQIRFRSVVCHRLKCQRSERPEEPDPSIGALSPSSSVSLCAMCRFQH